LTASVRSPASVHRQGDNHGASNPVIEALFTDDKITDGGGGDGRRLELRFGCPRADALSQLIGSSRERAADRRQCGLAHGFFQASPWASPRMKKRKGNDLGVVAG
jgi:hypothetical protein